MLSLLSNDRCAREALSTAVAAAKYATVPSHLAPPGDRYKAAPSAIKWPNTFTFSVMKGMRGQYVMTHSLKRS